MPQYTLAGLQVAFRALAGKRGSGRNDLMTGEFRIGQPTEALPRVSFVIPAFNAEATLQRTIACLIRQTVASWEAVVVDDGSLDGTAALVEAARLRDRRIRLISQENAGVSAARNVGIAAAMGEWLVFLDADDWVSPHYLRVMLAALQLDPQADVARCGHARTSSIGEEVLLSRVPDFRGDPFTCLAHHCSLGAIHAYMLKRSLVLEVGAFDEGLCTYEDWDFLQRVFRTGARVVQTPEVVAFYAACGGSLSRRRADRMISDGRTVFLRGCAPDPRVKRPSPLYAEGIAAGRSVESECLQIASWCAGTAIGSGGDNVQLLDQVWDFSDTSNLGVPLHEGLIIGSSLSPERLAAEWPRFAERVERLVAAIASRGAGAGSARAIFEELAMAMALTGPVTGQRILGTTLLARFAPWLLVSGIDVPRNVDTVLLQITPGRALHMPVLGPLTGPAMCAALLSLAQERGWKLARKFAQRAESLQHGSDRAVRAVRRITRLALKGVRLATGDGAPGGRLRHGLQARRTAALIAEARASVSGALPVAGPAGTRPAVAEPQLGPSTPHLPILMYHQISDLPGRPVERYRLSPDRFERQLRFLRRHGFRSVGLDEWSATARLGGRFPGRPIVLTFDDGTRDFYETAWPILERYGFSAVVFVVTDQVGGIADWPGLRGSGIPLMDWQHIAELHGKGIEFGSHLAIHTPTSQMTSEQVLWSGARSRATLERALGRSVTTVAVPYGITSRRVRWLLRGCGYDSILTTRPGFASSYGTMLDIPRIEISGDDDLDRFARKLQCRQETVEAEHGLEPSLAPA